MPFPSQTPRVYNYTNVSALNRNQMGCYGLFKTGAWIYVGKGDIRDRLLAHINGDNPCITRNAPTHWVDHVTPNYDAEEKSLIKELDPICNRRIG